ncbi:hypothetical protein [Streptomyces sp. NPDC057460]|uniref:hypothetical protein n=1 Tax=Streptomyces sp. NPDC057460 TaxID=3346141 RepID=UPI0036B1FB2B
MKTASDEPQPGAGRAEFGTDRRDGDIDDEGVELGHEPGREDRGEQSAGVFVRGAVEVRGAAVGGAVIDALDPHPAVVHSTGYDVLATNAARPTCSPSSAITATGIRKVAWTLFTVAEKDCPVVRRPRACGLPVCRIMAYTPADEESGAGGDAAPTP